MVSKFEELEVWKKTCRIAISIYKTTAGGKLATDFGLRDQLRRSAVSIPSNIAEGKERETVNELIRYLFIAKGSAAELQTQLFIAYEIEYLDKQIYLHFSDELREISAMLGSFIRRLKRGRGWKDEQN